MMTPTGIDPMPDDRERDAEGNVIGPFIYFRDPAGHLCGLIAANWHTPEGRVRALAYRATLAARRGLPPTAITAHATGVAPAIATPSPSHHRG